MAKLKRTKDPQNTTEKTKDRAVQDPDNALGERRCSGRVDSSCPTRCILQFNLVSNPMRKDGIVTTTEGTYLCHRYSVAVH
jgi:hypothetical protein